MAAARSTISIKALAKETGLDGRTVAAILRRAGIDAENGAYPAVTARRAVEGGLEPGLAAGQAMAGRGNVVSPAISALSLARARSEMARAEKLEIDNRRVAGRLLELDAVDTAVRDVIARAKAHLTGIGFKVANKVVHETNSTVIANIIDGEIRAALTTLGDIEKLTDEVLQ